MLKTSNRPRADDAFFWSAEYYSRAKQALTEQGDGLRKDVVKHFLPKHAIPGNETLKGTPCREFFESLKAVALINSTVPPQQKVPSSYAVEPDRGFNYELNF